MLTFENVLPALSASKGSPDNAWTCPPGLRPEGLLLCAVASPNGRLVKTTIHDLLRHDLDWEHVLRAGAQNDILPLLYWRLNSGCAERVPPAVLKQLRAVFADVALRNLSLTNELIRLLALFDKHNLRSIPFKGPALALSLYGNLALRRIGDLDILVQKEDVGTVRRLMSAEGYRLQPEISADQEDTHLEFEEDFHFHREADDFHVEIHWAVIQKHLCRHADIRDVWHRVMASSVAGQPILAFLPEDLFIVLCIHGHKHDWKTLKLVADVAWMIEGNQAVDWDVVLRRAQSLKQQHAVLMGCALAESLFGTPISSKLVPYLDSDRIRARAALIRGRLFRSDACLPGFGEWRSYIDEPGESFDKRVEPLRSRSIWQYVFAVLTPETCDHFMPKHPKALSRFLYERSSFQCACRAWRSIRKHRSGVLTLLK